MPKINGAGEPTWADARGTDEMATNARDETYLLDPTAHPDEERNAIVDNEGLTIEGDDERERFETREEREQREQREREENARERRDETLDDAEGHAHESGDYDSSKPNPGTVAKNVANERSATDKPAGADTAKSGADKSGADKSDAGVTSSAGTPSKASSKPLGKTSGSN